MRIDLLLQREPFGQILEQTLARFWAGQHGRKYAVRWQQGASLSEMLRPRALRSKGSQPWLANVYLNAIFTADAAPAVFDPLRRDYSRSPVWWKRPLQRTYVSLASSRRGARWLAQAALRVIPEVPGARHQVIVAGNHKIRLLDHETGLAYGILKAGFEPGFMQRELATRREAADCHLPVPPLVSVAADQTWFSERFVSGTPLNRLIRPSQAQAAALKAARQLHRFLLHTRAEVDRQAYVRQLQAQIETLIERNPLLSATLGQTVLAQTKALVDQLAGDGKNGCDLTTALTHGDFQPANILVNRHGVWLIDWEYSGRRQAGYDALVLALAARLPHGLAGRLRAFVEQGWPAESPAAVLAWPGMATCDRDGRRQHATLFLLEELHLHLEENAQPALTGLGQGLLVLQSEIAGWLAMTATESKDALS